MTVAASAPEPVQLTAADRGALSIAAAQLMELDLWTQPEEWVAHAQLLSAGLSVDLRRRLFAFRRFGDASGGLLIRGIPVGDIPATPSDTGTSEVTRGEPAAAMSVLLACLGEQYGFRPELGGRLVQDILPVTGFETQQISLGSTVDLECHTEMAFSDHRSDFVALLCLRPDHERIAGTSLHPVEVILPNLDSETVGVLRERRFRTKVDSSFRLGDELPGELWVEPISVFDGPAERPHLRVDFAETDGMDDAARDALNRMRVVAGCARSVVRLEPGDLLVVDNHRALHGRTPFAPRYDGADRWLLRSFVTKDLRPSEAFRPGDNRIIEPDYDTPRA